MDTLKYLLSSVNDWLKFAEAKNAVLVTTSGLALWAISRLLLTVKMPCVLEVYFAFLIVFLCAALINSLLSFLPVLNYTIIIPKKKIIGNKNLLYFGYLATLSKNNLLKQYRAAGWVPDFDHNELHSMYAEQIIINSRIAFAKFIFFERSVNFVILGALTPVIGGIFLIFAKNKRNKTDGFG